MSDSRTQGYFTSRKHLERYYRCTSVLSEVRAILGRGISDAGSRVQARDHRRCYQIDNEERSKQSKFLGNLSLS